MDFILYVQTQCFQSNVTRDDHRRIFHHTKYYLIINYTLYHRGVDVILCYFLTHKEAEIVLNDCHSRACGDHVFGMATT